MYIQYKSSKSIRQYLLMVDQSVVDWLDHLQNHLPEHLLSNIGDYYNHHIYH